MQPNRTTEPTSVVKPVANSILELNNAAFAGVQSLKEATVLLGSESKTYLFANVTSDNLTNITESFDRYIAEFKTAAGAQSSRRIRKHAADLFVQSVVPALNQAGIDVVDIINADDACVIVDGQHSASSSEVTIPRAGVTMRIPLRQGFKSLFRNHYDIHALFEETVHVLQDVNGGPLSKLGLTVQKALEKQDPALLSRLAAKWKSTDPKMQRLFVKENDVAGVYHEFGLNVPGLYYYFYDRRAVQSYLQTVR